MLVVNRKRFSNIIFSEKFGAGVHAHITKKNIYKVGSIEVQLK